MAVAGLDLSQIEALVGTRHAGAGFEYPPNGLQPYYEWLTNSLHLLGESSAGVLLVQRDDGGDTLVHVAAGRVTIGGQALSFAGQTIDLAAFNNDTALVWAEDVGGAVSIGTGPSASGWPASAHLKLAEVVLSAGVITQITDRRFETMLGVGLDARDAVSFATYSLSITTQGDTATPTNVLIKLRDHHGQPIATVDHLRVRVCDSAGYLSATNATLTVGAGTAAAETIAAGTDLVLQSDATGQFNIDVTNAVAETVTLRIGAALLSARRGDYSGTLDVTHV